MSHFYKLRAPLEISDFDPKKLQFLIKSPPNQRAVEKQLEAVYGKPIWPKKTKSYSLTVECTLTFETKDCRKLAQTWETKVRENLSKFLDLLHVCKHTTLQEAFPLLLNELKYLIISNPDAVSIVLEKSNHEIYVTGHKQAVTDVSKQVSDIILKVDQELHRKKQQVQEEKQLKRHLVLMLQFYKFEQELQKKYKDISLKYDISKNLVKFEGLCGEVTSAIVEMYEFTSKVVKTEVGQFSKLLQQFLQQQPVYMYVNSKMKERNIIGIWEFCKGEETLTVFSMSDQQAVQAAHLIKESVIETPIKLSNESTALLPTSEWQSKVKEIEQNGQGLIRIIAQADQGRIIILCTDQWEGLAREYIEDFMVANTIYEESLNLEQSMMKYLQMNCAGDLYDVGRSLQSEKVNIVVMETGIIVKATQTGVYQAKYAIDKIIQEVQKQMHLKNTRGIWKWIKSSPGQEKQRNVERSQGFVTEAKDESASGEETSSSRLKSDVNKQSLAVSVTKKISAIVVDMLNLDVGASENPINKDMYHTDGVANSIVDKGQKQAVTEVSKQVADIILKMHAEHSLTKDVSDLSMSQHCVECQTCGCYSEFYCNACHQQMCGECRKEHLKHPDNTQHEVCRYEDRKLLIPSVPCKIHPRQQLTLCCENCKQAICALCTTKGHAGHKFLDLEEVYTKKYKTRIEQIHRIRDDMLPKTRLRLKESRNATLEIKGNMEMLKSSMKEQASQIKGLVDAILSENLEDLHSYEAFAVDKLEKQETALDTYVTQMQAMLEEYKNSMPSENPVEFLSELNDSLNVNLEPIPELLKISPGNFSHGTLSKEEIRKQFGVLTKPTNET